MKQYKKLILDVFSGGVEKDDRTGTGTISIFGHQSRYDLSEGFPLVTTKKVHLKSIIHELLWFLKGDTNVKYLQDNGVSIWDEWADENGNLGAVYGHLWRNFGGKYDNIAQPRPVLEGGFKPTKLGIANGDGCRNSPLRGTWQNMIERCYNSKASGYDYYGAKGVHVCNRWLVFKNFEIDAKKLQGWELKNADWDNFQLDKDILGNGFRYSPTTCIWASLSDNYASIYNKTYTVEKDGVHYSFNNISDFARSNNIEAPNLSRVINGVRRTVSGFSLISVKDNNLGIDQISNVVRRIKENPDSRRLIVSSWDSNSIDDAILPPCHTLFQFYVANGRLSLQLYQRSADIFLGVPFNIASYSLLLMMMAQVTGLEAGEFIHTIGDAHIYSNHIEQCKLQLSRAERPLPTMTLNPDIKDIFDFKYEDFTLSNYNPHPSIKGEVAV